MPGPLARVGLGVFWVTRWWNGRASSTTSIRSRCFRRAAFKRILVPMKIGEIGEEMVATAIATRGRERCDRRGDHRRARAAAYTLEGELPEDVRHAREASLAEARVLGEDNGVEIVTDIVRARSIGHAVVEEAPDAAPTSSFSARRRAGAASRASSRRPSTTCCATPPARCSSWRSRRGSWRIESRAQRYASPMKAVIVGCGRVGSKVALELADDGWDVTCVDEDEEALARGSAPGRAASSSGTGWTSTFSRRPVSARPARSSATDGDNSNLVIGQVIQRRWGLVRRRARAGSRTRRLLRRPRSPHRLSDADDDHDDADAVRACDAALAGGG